MGDRLFPMSAQVIPIAIREQRPAPKPLTKAERRKIEQEKKARQKRRRGSLHH
jgi:hypothetical protein